mmetsp:Transcript_35468/g.52090  ORF Transcript_35468/g.52090 Transcript_35468/m.52090 type:complete len:227 (+) Transcript_35468:2007-2687(+)
MQPSPARSCHDDELSQDWPLAAISFASKVSRKSAVAYIASSLNSNRRATSSSNNRWNVDPVAASAIAAATTRWLPLYTKSDPTAGERERLAAGALSSNTRRAHPSRLAAPRVHACVGLLVRLLVMERRWCSVTCARLSEGRVVGFHHGRYLEGLSARERVPFSTRRIRVAAVTHFVALAMGMRDASPGAMLPLRSTIILLVACPTINVACWRRGESWSVSMTRFQA